MHSVYTVSIEMIAYFKRPFVVIIYFHSTNIHYRAGQIKIIGYFNLCAINFERNYAANISAYLDYKL